MDKILKLLIDGYQNHKPSVEYQLALNKYCAAEFKFFESLDDKQKAEYMKLDFIAGELNIEEPMTSLSICGRTCRSEKCITFQD
ncbi:MAG: hypothetical protein FWC00_01135 [Firmicutes bacterium]|nr:hypothetical protein [Bacillota bacterium]